MDIINGILRNHIRNSHKEVYFLSCDKAYNHTTPVKQDAAKSAYRTLYESKLSAVRSRRTPDVHSAATNPSGWVIEATRKDQHGPARWVLLSRSGTHKESKLWDGDPAPSSSADT